MLKEVLKKCIPSCLLKIRRRSFVFYRSMSAYYHDFIFYYRYSDSNESDTSIKLLGNIIANYHGIEKGLTMPSIRFGFGQQKLVILINDCISYIKKYDKSNDQLRHAIGVVYEYKKVHEKCNYLLEDHLLKNIIELEKLASSSIVCTQQIRVSKEEYWKNSTAPFDLFSESRFSVRNFSNEELSVNEVLASIELAKNAPSACNRQSWRTYIVVNKKQIEEILFVQGGNRGFGHLINKLILVTGEVGLFRGQGERNQVFVDGGIYAMNLLYALHFNKVGACILNCSNSLEKDAELRSLTPIKETEAFIAIIGCGNLPDEFDLTISKRSPISFTNTLVTSV